jgi:ribosomal protein S18 acetylase RimI-like enzyme
MECSLANGVAPRPEQGFTVAAWAGEHDEPARLVYNEAFADHWGSVPMDAETWRKQIVDNPGFRRGYSFVAIADGEVVGYASCEEYPEDWEAAGRSEAWIGGLGVLRPWRKRGIATALLARAMIAMSESGTDYAMIGVDSDSPSGAQHLYKSLGFTTKTTGVTWQLAVDAE